MSEAARPLIAHVIHRMDVGGMENGLVNVINGLPRDRFRHAIVSLTDSTDFAERLERDDVEIVSLGKGPGNDLRLYARLYRTFRRLRPTIVHTRNLAAIEAVAPAALSGVPHRIHGEHGRDVQDPEGRKSKYRWLRRGLSPWVDRFIALSRELHSYLVEGVGIPASKVVRICNGVDTRRFYPGPHGRQSLPPGASVDTSGFVVIGSVTRMQEVKDPVTLARAFTLLVQRGLAPKARLVLVGDGPLKSRVEEVLREGDAYRYAWLAGSRDDIPSLLRSFDVFALSSRVEGISNTILEAMATGLPVVATRVGGNEEIVVDGETGSLVPSGDPEALAGALARVIEDATLRSALGRAARARVEREFTLEGMLYRYQDVYEEVLTGVSAARFEKAEQEAKLRCAE
jgi:sugar transferase (PEP-CTERM/EpsH1 system associated)